jgi:hypothetical protein
MAFGACTAAACAPGCRRDPPVDTAPEAAVAVPSVAVSITPAPVEPSAKAAACAVAYAQGEGVPGPGSDLSEIAVPMTIPGGANLTVSVRQTGHEVRLVGPAVFRPCTHDEPESLLVVLGEAAVSSGPAVRPGAEVFVGTPSVVAVVGRGALRLAVTSGQTMWEVDEPDVVLTNLDSTRTPSAKDKGFFKRPDDGGVLLTRCVVQAASAAGAERLLLAIGSGDAGPLPSASIGILTARSIRVSRERTLNCAYAEAFALGCDLLSSGADARPPGCAAGGYQEARGHLARAIASTPIPPGSPPLPSNGPPPRDENPAKGDASAPGGRSPD